MISINKIANQFSNRNRLNKYNYFLDYFKPSHNTKILDAGASEREYQENANILEKLYPYPENITVLGIDEYCDFRKRYPRVKVVKYNEDRWPFCNKEFDICWSNATLEHVGNRQKQKEFLKEAFRVAKKVFITTPNRFFPFEVHTRVFLLHYLPKGLFDRILTKIGPSWAVGNYMHLLTLRDIKRLLADCHINEYKIIKNRIFGLTVDFVIIF